MCFLFDFPASTATNPLTSESRGERGGTFHRNKNKTEKKRKSKKPMDNSLIHFAV